MPGEADARPGRCEVIPRGIADLVLRSPAFARRAGQHPGRVLGGAALDRPPGGGERQVKAVAGARLLLSAR